MTIRSNLSLMQTDVSIQYQQALDESHHGRPMVVQLIYTSNWGCPQLEINPEFLQWAYAHRSISGISRYLNIHRDTVQNALLDYGIAEPQTNPFAGSSGTADTNPEIPDDLLDPDLATTHIPVDILSDPPVVSFTGPLSTLQDNQLDDLIIQLRSHFSRVGIRMLDGMLCRLGHRLPCEHIRESLMCIDPVQWVFQRIQIWHRVYFVPGPNALWHHDGQHGQFYFLFLIPLVFNFIIVNRPHPMGHCNTWVYQWLFLPYHRPPC